MDYSHIIIVLLALITIPILIFSVLIYNKVQKLQQGNCAGVPEFNSTSTYTKSITIPLVNKTISGSAIFKNDGTFILDVAVNGTQYSYTDNKWTYDKDNCQIIVTLDSTVQNAINEFGVMDNDVKLNNKGQLIVSVTILGLIPLQITLDKK